MEKLNALETALPFCAVMEAVPCCAIRFAGTVAVSKLAFATNARESANPFQ